MARYAVLNADNIVVNVIEWDGVTPYDPGEGLTLQFVPTVDIGRVWDGNDYVPPVSEETTTTPPGA